MKIIVAPDKQRDIDRHEQPMRMKDGQRVDEPVARR